MAIIFELWAECKDEANLQKFKEHFHGLKHTLLTGREITFRADIENSEVRGINVWSSQICGNGRGIESLTDALESTEAGIFLYHRLKTAPDFRFARIGWDAEKYPSFDLFNYVDTLPDGRKHWVGHDCVFDDELYKELGSPVAIWKFREGYWWSQYRGETYNPLISTDQVKLFDLCEQLLPDNFDY